MTRAKKPGRSLRRSEAGLREGAGDGRLTVRRSGQARFFARFFPLLSVSISKVSFSPSVGRTPSLGNVEIWTKISWPPRVGVMNPKFWSSFYLERVPSMRIRDVQCCSVATVRPRNIGTPANMRCRLLFGGRDDARGKNEKAKAAPDDKAA